jgi:hypothetical protein
VDIADKVLLAVVDGRDFPMMDAKAEVAKLATIQ